jgi:hypothetical protein
MNSKDDLYDPTEDKELLDTKEKALARLEAIEAKLGERYGVKENIREFLIDLDLKNELVEDELVQDWHGDYAWYVNCFLKDEE